MDSELKIILSFLFKRSGKESLKFSDLYLALSMDLNWFTPADAKAFVNKALEEKLLLKKGDLIKPSFDVYKIDVPIGFCPSKLLFNEKKEKIAKKKEDVLSKIVNQIVEKTDLNEQQVTEKIHVIAKEKNITDEVTALLICKEYDIKFFDFIKEIEEKIFRSS
jgi:hypothetical protein